MALRTLPGLTKQFTATFWASQATDANLHATSTVGPGKMAGPARVEPLYRRVKEILAQARMQAWQSVNRAMVGAYWQVGQVIVEEEQRGKQRADYGQHVLKALWLRLQIEYGKGFGPSNLSMMRAFYLTYPIFDALRQELSWTHYRLLLRVGKPDARAFYEIEAVNAHWSTREWDRQIHALLFERLALSRDKAGVVALSQKGHEIYEPTDLVKDSYVLEFTGLANQERYLEVDLERALIDKLQQFHGEKEIMDSHWKSG